MNESKMIALIASNDGAVCRAMVVLFARQEPDEQRSSTTRHDNRRGFRADNAGRCTWYAMWVLGLPRNATRTMPDTVKAAVARFLQSRSTGRPLTGSHLDYARKQAHLHRMQLVQVANARRQ